MDVSPREPPTPPGTGLADPRDLITPPDEPQPLPLTEKSDADKKTLEPDEDQIPDKA